MNECSASMAGQTPYMGAYIDLPLVAILCKAVEGPAHKEPRPRAIVHYPRRCLLDGQCKGFSMWRNG